MSQGLPKPRNHRYPDAVYKYIGLSEYPIFDEGYRNMLNDKIIDHFYFREIGFETAAQFAWQMRRTMNEIMPYYNALYDAQIAIDDPLHDFQRGYSEQWGADRHDTSTLSSTVNRDIDESETSQTSSTDHNRNVFQDTPMSLLSNEGSPSIEGLDYATTVTYDDGSGTVSGTRGTSRGEQDNTETEDNLDRNESGNKVRNEIGRNHSQSYLFSEYRENYINIDLEIIGELETLFMGLW